MFPRVALCILIVVSVVVPLLFYTVWNKTNWHEFMERDNNSNGRLDCIIIKTFHILLILCDDLTPTRWATTRNNDDTSPCLLKYTYFTRPEFVDAVVFYPLSSFSLFVACDWGTIAITVLIHDSFIKRVTLLTHTNSSFTRSNLYNNRSCQIKDLCSFQSACLIDKHLLHLSIFLINPHLWSTFTLS